MHPVARSLIVQRRDQEWKREACLRPQLSESDDDVPPEVGGQIGDLGSIARWTLVSVLLVCALLGYLQWRATSDRLEASG